MNFDFLDGFCNGMFVGMLIEFLIVVIVEIIWGRRERMSDKMQQREVNGLFFDLYKNRKAEMFQAKIMVRVTKDNHGKSISLADQKRGYVLEIPLESIEDLI